MTNSSGKPITIIGGGLAGSEAAWQLACRGHAVTLIEMRPVRKTEAHQGTDLAELVCSNSFRGASLRNAVGLLKEEMRLLDSLILAAADHHAIPGGSALVMDREGFAKEVTERLYSHPNIEVCREEIKDLRPWLGEEKNSPSLLLIATGPLTSSSMAQALQEITGEDSLYFYDSIAPIVMADSIDMKKVFRASRYDKGTADYLNCPLNREEYGALVQALQSAEKVPTKDFEKPKYFEACLPVEVLAERGLRSLAFGPMKPVGLIDPRTGRRPYAVVQLRQDDLHAQLFNMVGFQTRMKYPEQQRIFRMIPGLEQAQFARLGSMHRNTYLNAPKLLNQQLQLKSHPGISLAGQMIGVEGYVESAAMGLYAGLVLHKRNQGQSLAPPGADTALGSLIRHLTQSDPNNFQPMNVNFGLLDLPPHLQGKAQRELASKQALEYIREYRHQHGLVEMLKLKPLPLGA